MNRMDVGVILNISKTHLLARVKQSVIAALGVTFGISAYIILMSFMTGLNGMLDGLVTNRTPHVRVYKELVPTAYQPIDEYNPESWNVVRSIKPKQIQQNVRNALPLMNLFRNDPRVMGVTAQIATQVFYLSGTIELNGRISGIDAVEESRLFNFSDYIVDGTAEELTNSVNGIILGIGVAKKMSVKKGDRIQVLGTNGVLTSLKIVGFYQSGLSDVDDIQSYANLSTAQRIQGESSGFLTDINIKLKDITLAPEMAIQIARDYDVNAIDINKANAQFETGSQIRNLISYAVSITLLIVAGFGIYNILNMLIYEKINDIAILKAVGFSGRDVQMIFISQALIIGLAGGFLGLGVGFLMSVLIDNTPFEAAALPTMTTYPVNFNPLFYLGGGIFAIITTFFAGYLPARKAGNIDPVEIIRGQ